MADKVWWVLALSASTFVLVVAILLLLIRRGGRSIETAAVLQAVRKVDQSLVGMRSQNSAEHSFFQAFARSIWSELVRLTDRFGFLKSRDPLSEPLQKSPPKDPSRDSHKEFPDD